jgi:MFS family permease
LLVVFSGINFGTGMVAVMLTPLVLNFATAAELGVVVSAGAAGSFVGGLLISAWGGPERRLPMVFGVFATGAAMLTLVGLVPSPTWVAVGYFGFMFCFPIAQSCNEAIWQVKVPPELQGRVISIRRAIATASMPIAYLLCGPLADHVFEPMLAAGGFLAASLGQLVGVGPGRGIGLMVVLVAICNLGVLALGWSHPRVRRIEDEIPDAFGEAPAAAQAPPAGGDGEDEPSAAGSGG